MIGGGVGVVDLAVWLELQAGQNTLVSGAVACAPLERSIDPAWVGLLLAGEFEFDCAASPARKQCGDGVEVGPKRCQRLCGGPTHSRTTIRPGQKGSGISTKRVRGIFQPDIQIIRQGLGSESGMP